MRKIKDVEIFPDTKIFIVCPAAIKTGGTEVIHQLANSLQKYYDTYIYYVELNKPIVPEAFRIYECKYVYGLATIYDNNHNILIVPETHTKYLFRYKHIQKMLWWLSVDNYSVYLQNNDFYSNVRHFFYADKFYFELHRKRVVHLYQSEYARKYLHEKGVKGAYYLSDYINDIYVNEMLNVSSDLVRENIVLYNPKKGLDFTKTLMVADETIKYVPVIGMTNDEIMNIMRRSKVYIDFGYHPGKDRLPREAAAMGLCIITNRKGSASNDIDVNIPDKYKFEDEEREIANIINMIHRCFESYDDVKHDFDNYRKRIATGKEEFERCIKHIFLKEGYIYE